MVLLLLLALAGCASTPAALGSTAASPPADTSGAAQTLRLATTTSTEDSGLLDAILPDFEDQYSAKVDVVAVGTGQALRIGASGDADVVLVHARKLEDAFVSAGNGIDRRDVMYNDFVIVGPSDDPAQIGDMDKAANAFSAIAAAGAPFAARGDGSGTATREAGIWATASISPTAAMAWYKSLGQGMGATLTFANEQRAYALTDRGTFLAMADKLPNLKILVGGQSIAENKDSGLLNPYGVIVVNPATHPGVNSDLAARFAAWLTAPATQAMIGEYGKQKFGQPLFYPGVPKT